MVTSTTTFTSTIGSFLTESYTNLSQDKTKDNLQSPSTKLIRRHSTLSGTKTVIEVQNPIMSLAIPQSITVIFFLIMAGLGGFLKLKIVHAKLKNSNDL
ncbi:hypothetical protein [Cyanobacterium sp. uoEpiScrs1]|uniref:hypothetical protein n=1 Tax=Cyanobacterium sp. uoEpiScrs1 TaxID=2976343 RepID=UPI002269840C|nr:hypothetical protein [Cyanobacterium sp. uoEpiScrs1]